MRLTNLPVGSKGKIINLTARGKKRRRLLDLGFLPGTIIKVKQKSPLGDPTAYEVRGAVIALRSEETDLVESKVVKEEKEWD